uniref:hypothetical protein n=1 Tax=Microcoleus sp. bin38.metabat.b11b12b14.051 TaxID=2742709 RepID=UPI0025F0A497
LEKTRFLGPRHPAKKPGFCPNLWVVGKYFGKNPVSGTPRSTFGQMCDRLLGNGRSGDRKTVSNKDKLKIIMRVIEITEAIDPLAEYANSQEPIMLTRNGQIIAALMPFARNPETDELPSNVQEAIEQLSLSEESASARSRQQTELATTFYQLVEQWKTETRGISSTEQLSLHPAYQQIIGMGPDVIPLLLREIEKKSGRWFWALKAISREEPVTPEQQGKTKETIAAWLNWGREKGYKWTEYVAN